MKLDKTGKAWAKWVGLVFWSIFACLYGGLYNPWVQEAPIEGKVWMLAFTLMFTLLCVSLAYFTEEKE